MDSPEATPAQPNLPPNIRHAPGLTLTAAEAILLARAFPDNQEIFVEREFRSGYSGAVVLLVSPGSGQAQVVVKLGSAAELQREYVAYRQYVKQASPQNTARLQGEPLLTDDEQLALLSYTFAGGDPRRPTNSLQAYYESKGGQATAAVLDRVFRTYGRQWWAINRPQKFVVSEQYDRLLPVHLKLKLAETIETNPRTLVAGQINAAALRDLQPGQPILLKGFQVAETRLDRQEVKLTANPPPGEASAPLRLRLETDEVMAYQLGERVETLDTVITATRQTILAEAASSALPAFAPEAADLSLNDRTCSNPLLQLSDLLDRVVEAKVSTIHGDLNLQNILVDEETGFAWLIDFAETRHGPTLFDLQRLESQVITKLLPPVIAQAGLEPVIVSDLLESLHTDPPSPTTPHAVLQEAYTMLVTLRRLARQYLIDDRDWDEYYLGLVITLLGSLKYPELEPLGRHLALVGAAVAQELMGKPLEPVTGQVYAGREDIIINNFDLAYQELRKILPKDDPVLQRLVESLKIFAAYHELINEWKELHNLLQELHNSIGPFYDEVERLYDYAQITEIKSLRRQWRLCQRQIHILMGFAESIKFIWSKPYYEENGRFYGPPWMVKIVQQQRDIEEMLKEGECDISELYNLASEFSNDCYKHLYQADKSLRDEAGNLYQLSTRILAKLTE